MNSDDETDDEYTDGEPDPRWLEWAEAVVNLVQAAGRAKGRRDEEPAAEYLERCRGDEPAMAWAMGDSAEKYATELMDPGPLNFRLHDGQACNQDGDTGFLDPDVEL